MFKLRTFPLSTHHVEAVWKYSKGVRECSKLSETYPSRVDIYVQMHMYVHMLTYNYQNFAFKGDRGCVAWLLFTL